MRYCLHLQKAGLWHNQNIPGVVSIFQYHSSLQVGIPQRNIFLGQPFQWIIWPTLKTANHAVQDFEILQIANWLLNLQPVKGVGSFIDNYKSIDWFKFVYGRNSSVLGDCTTARTYQTSLLRTSLETLMFVFSNGFCLRHCNCYNTAFQQHQHSRQPMQKCWKQRCSQGPDESIKIIVKSPLPSQRSLALNLGLTKNYLLCLV